MLTGMAFGLLTFHRRPRERIKLLQPGCCKVKVSEMEILRSKRSKVKVTLQFYWPKRYPF